jgi:hypothetical protein
MARNMPPSFPRTSGPRKSRAGSDLLVRSQLPAWVVRALIANRIRRFSQLGARSDEELLALSGVGQRAVQIIRAELARTAQRGVDTTGVVPQPDVHHAP